VKEEVRNQRQTVPRNLGQMRWMTGEGGTFAGRVGGRVGRSAGFVPVLWDGRWCCVCMRPERWDPKRRMCVSPRVGSEVMCGEPKEEWRHGAAYVNLADGQAQAVGWIGSGRRGF
jgi:hypothetical protein